MTAPTVDDAVQPTGDAPGSAKTYGDVVAVPHLLDEGTDDATVCKSIHKIWSDQRDLYARYNVECEVNVRRRQGENNIWVNKVQDQALYTVYVPAGRRNLLNQFGNLTDQTCQQFVAQITQDPAKPEAIPSTGEDEDRDAAEFSTRVLENECSESGLDANEAMKAAQDFATTHGSGWVWAYTDTMGGGRQPVEIQAHPLAPHADVATQNPETGAEAGQEELVPKFVKDDGGLTDQKGESSLRWVPRVARQVVPGTKVRLWPYTAQDVWDADGLLYLDYQPRSVVETMLPEVQLTEEEWDAACNFRLTDARHLLPQKNGKPYDPKPSDRKEDWLVLIARFWAPEGSAYPDGAYICCIGDQKVAHKGPWILQTETGEREKLDIPWAQVRQFRDSSSGHPHGKGLVSFIGAPCDYLTELYGRFSELTDMAANRKILLPFASTIQPHEIQNPATDVLHFQPGQKPEYEQVPEPPRALETLIELCQNAIREASFLAQGAGLDAPEANSGRQALAIVAQAHAGLSDVNQCHNRAWVRLWRIILQCIRSDYSIPQLLKVTGPDGSYKVDRWTKSDLGSTRDVEIAKGSGTLMNQVQKVQAAAEARQILGLDPDDLQEQLATGLSSVVAFEDNRFLMRIRRQIAEWEKGPPEGWEEQRQAAVAQTLDPITGQPRLMANLDPATGQPALDPITRMPALPQPQQPPPDPLLAKIWRPVTSDMLPVAAKWRVRELAKAQQSAGYLDLPEEWAQSLDMELARAQQALQPPAPPPGLQNAGPAAQRQTVDEKGQPKLSDAEQAAAGAPA